MRGLFISHRGFLDGPGGGVQACTREYRTVIEAAGIELTTVAYDTDRRLSTRLLRRIDSSPYLRPAEPGLLETVRRTLEQASVDFIFLNDVSLAAVADSLRACAPSPSRIVLLSHGMESTDLLHLIRLRRKLPLRAHVRPSANIALGRLIRAEEASRRHVDAVFVISPFDIDLEHWMGSRNVHWLPRIVTPDPLDWRPVGNRLGYVGTLNHPPNLEGLVAALDELVGLSADGPRIRVVGGPPRIGTWLTARYANVEYLGSLDDGALAREAASWIGFLHPIFCYPRGCSTKLATAIGWQIPIVTTPQGRRGYVWREGSLLESSGPGEFASRAMALLDPLFAEAARAEVARVAVSSPTLPEIAARLRRNLDASAADRGQS